MRSLIALLALSAPALAERATLAREIPCYCTDTDGERVEIGRRACLVVDGRAFMGLCEMALNVPSWRDTGAACLSSRLDDLTPAAPRAGAPSSPPAGPG